MTGRRLVALAGLAAAIACSTPTENAPPAVILISLDTLAAGHMQCYGYARETSPNLCAFADESLTFVNAYSASCKTAESHMTMFTSVYPSVHRVETTEEVTIRPLGDEIATLAEILAGNGYRNVGFHGGGMVGEEFGFARGFERYEQAPAESHKPVQWLKRHGRRGGFFLFLHTYRVHDPYTPEPPYDAMFDPDYDGEIAHYTFEERVALEEAGGWELSSQDFWDTVDRNDPDDLRHLVALYDGVIAELDADLGRLFETIDRYAPSAIVIVLSDHGEEFKQHGEFLHRQLYGEVLRVPLMIRHPDIPGGIRVEHDVSLIDLAPTILDLLSIPAPEQFQGRSLLQGLEPAPSDRTIYGELPFRDMRTIIRGGRKLVVHGDRMEAYDLRQDPGERHDLYGDDALRPAEGSAFGELEAELERMVDANRALADRYEAGEERTLDEETLERLRQLGYIE
jgi:arylsulfatase A-like enzyme